MKFLYPLMALAIVFMVSCNDEDTTDETTLPTTYNFENVSYSGQTTRLDMLAEITNELKKANSGNTVDGAKLVKMFKNEDNQFSETSLNESSKNLFSKCFSGQGGAYSAAIYEYLMTRQGQISANASNTWAPGTAGVATSGSKAYFFDEFGVEYTQLIEKGLMGAVFYYQASEVYTREGKIGNAVDNETVTPGKGTDMEHHWDEAFGYWGAPIDFSSANHVAKIDAKEARYHGKYANKGEAVGIKTVDNLMTAFIKGRYGISNKNYTMRDEAATAVRENWEVIIATTAIHYLNSAKSNFADDALRNHALSEAYAFVMSLYYNADKKISTTDLSTVRGLMEALPPPPAPQNPVPSFLNITTADIDNAVNTLSTAYGLDAVKDQL